MGEVAEAPSGHMLTINPCNRGQMCVPRIAEGNLLPEERHTANEPIQKRSLIVWATESAWPKKTNFPEDLISLLAASMWQHVCPIGNAYVYAKVPLVIDIKLLETIWSVRRQHHPECHVLDQVPPLVESLSPRDMRVNQTTVSCGWDGSAQYWGSEENIKCHVLFLRSCNLALLFPCMKSPWAGKHF